MQGRGRKAAAEEEERKRAEANANNGYRTIQTVSSAPDNSSGANAVPDNATVTSPDIKLSPEASPTVSASTSSPVVQHHGYSSNQHYYPETSAYQETAQPLSPLTSNEPVTQNYSQPSQTGGYTSPQMTSEPIYGGRMTYAYDHSQYQHYQQPMASLSPPAIHHQPHTPESPDTQPPTHDVTQVGQGVPEAEGHVSYVDAAPGTSPQGSPYQDHPFGVVHAQYPVRTSNEDRWSKITTLFQAVRTRAGWGYSYPEASMVGLEDMLTRLAYETSPSHLVPNPNPNPNPGPLFRATTYYSPAEVSSYPQQSPTTSRVDSPPVTATSMDSYVPNTDWSGYTRRPVLYGTLAGAVDEPVQKQHRGQ